MEMAAFWTSLDFLIHVGGGGGGNRTRVQKYSTGSSTYLVLSFNVILPTRTHTLRQNQSPKFNREPSNPAQSDSLCMTLLLFPAHPRNKMVQS
jgi:hypothetical protein